MEDNEKEPMPVVTKSNPGKIPPDHLPTDTRGVWLGMLASGQLDEKRELNDEG